MNPIIRYLLILACCLLPPHTAGLADEVIQFRKGQTSGGVSGQVTNLIKTYQFRARKGQSISLTLAPASGDKGTLTLSLYAFCGEEYGKPLVDDTLTWQGVLPCSDRYSIDVKPGIEAMQQARVQRYTLTLTIR